MDYSNYIQHMPAALVMGKASDHLNRVLSGYIINELEDLSAAFDKIIRGEPDIVLIEHCCTPDAFALCAQINEIPDCPPVIIVLENDDEALIEQAFVCGAADALVYPLPAATTRHRLRQALAIKKMKHLLDEKEERYRVISNSITDYAYAYRVSPEGVLIKEWSTQAFETITGYAPSELKGDGWSSLIHPEDYPLTMQRFENLMQGKLDVTEFRIITKNGRVKWLRDYGQPVLDKLTGRVMRIYGAAQDITERRDTEEQLRAQAEALQKQNEELDAFAHTVAHDLKNPVAGMMGFASLMLNYYDRMTDDKIREYLSLIMESGYKLKEIINALLLLAGVNRAEPVKYEALDMKSIIEGAKKRLAGMIRDSEAEIIEPESYPTALGYAPWVEEVWANYLSNALKYGGTPPRIRFGADTPENGKIRFWIEDNGLGIPEADQSRVFTPFTRLNQIKTEGHGLGLSVVHRIVEKLGGEVGVTSVVGQGSVFSFTLPVG